MKVTHENLELDSEHAFQKMMRMQQQKQLMGILRALLGALFCATITRPPVAAVILVEAYSCTGSSRFGAMKTARLSARGGSFHRRLKHYSSLSLFGAMKTHAAFSRVLRHSLKKSAILCSEDGVDDTNSSMMTEPPLLTSKNEFETSMIENSSFVLSSLPRETNGGMQRDNVAIAPTKMQNRKYDDERRREIESTRRMLSKGVVMALLVASIAGGEGLKVQPALAAMSDQKTIIKMFEELKESNVELNKKIDTGIGELNEKIDTTNALMILLHDKTNNKLDERNYQMYWIPVATVGVTSILNFFVVLFTHRDLDNRVKAQFIRELQPGLLRNEAIGAWMPLAAFLLSIMMAIAYVRVG